MMGQAKQGHSSIGDCASSSSEEKAEFFFSFYYVNS